MKKTLLSAALFAAVLTACGPSAEQIEKQKQDSIRVADSIAAASAFAELEAIRVADSIANAEAQAKHMADSIAAAELAAKAAKGGKKTTTTDTKGGRTGAAKEGAAEGTKPAATGGRAGASKQ